MERIPTFIEGLDENLEGGVPKGSIVLITGAPGTMKSSLAYSILYHNALRGVPGLFITMEQSRPGLLAQMVSLGLATERTEDRLSVLDLAGLRKKFAEQKEQSWPWVNLLKLYTKGLKASFDYRLLVLDSLDALEIVAQFENVRKEFFDLLRWLRTLGCTLLVIGESPSETLPNGPSDGYARHCEDYLADGILHIRKSRQGEFGVQRQLRVVKMRGTRHDLSYHALVYEGGFKLRTILS
jgi:KaiC/GvpD/RAD55 family RecA-like ATPase